MSNQDELDRPRLDAQTRLQLRRMLALGPWCWPDAATRPEAAARALETVPAGAPTPRPGEALLVAVRGGTASLWALDVGRARHDDDVEVVPFGMRAIAAWRDAATSLPAALPLVWSSVEAAHARTPAGRLLDRVEVDPTRRGGLDAMLDGRSFGLSFVLALASLVFDRPLPDDVAASVTIDHLGRAGRVDRIGDKVRAVLRAAPRVRRFLVCRDQQDEARAAAGTEALELVGVGSAGEAIARVFGEEADLAEALVAAGSDPERRAELRCAFVRLAVGGRGAMTVWRPVARAAERALATWHDLDEDARWLLELARAVAERHDTNRGALRLPPPGLLSRQPAPLRLEIVANVVQHAADTGAPAAADATELAETHLVRGPEAFAAHLKLLGATARLLALAGRPAEALAMQQEAARGFLERMLPEEVSYPLSEWYRLAGALGDVVAFAEAERFERRVQALGGFGFAGSPYVVLARERARVQLHLDRRAAARALAGLAAPSSSGTPSHVASAAALWALRVSDLDGGDEAAPDVSALEARLTPDHAALRALLRALDGGDRGGSDAAEAALADTAPAIVAHLREAAPSSDERPAYLARFFPY